MFENVEDFISTFKKQSKLLIFHLFCVSHLS